MLLPTSISSECGDNKGTYSSGLLQGQNELRPTKFLEQHLAHGKVPQASAPLFYPGLRDSEAPTPKDSTLFRLLSIFLQPDQHYPEPGLRTLGKLMKGEVYQGQTTLIKGLKGGTMGTVLDKRVAGVGAEQRTTSRPSCSPRSVRHIELPRLVSFENGISLLTTAPPQATEPGGEGSWGTETYGKGPNQKGKWPEVQSEVKRAT